jgi:hypothetical protein
MFGGAGHAYVYFTYGMHHCLNFVTREEGVPQAVLARALDPGPGVGRCGGPGLLCRSLGIDSSYSHAYSFFLLAAFLYLTDRWYDDLTHGRGAHVFESMLLGVVAGLIVLTRHTNASFVLVFPLYGVTTGTTVRAVAGRLSARWRELAIGSCRNGGDCAAAGDLLSGHRARIRQFVWRPELPFPFAADLGRPLQRAEGAVLLVAAPARGRRRLRRG